MKPGSRGGKFLLSLIDRDGESLSGELHARVLYCMVPQTSQIDM